MVKALRGQNPLVDIVLQTMNPAWDSPDEPSHKKYAGDRPHLEDYYAVYRTHAREHGLPLMDHLPQWENCGKKMKPNSKSGCLRGSIRFPRPASR